MKLETILVIHGFNNNENLFLPLIDHFKTQGHKVVFITLPCHGLNRSEAMDQKSALACFTRSMNKHTKEPYSVIAFSQGSLYLQLWIKSRRKHLPRKQILLAPALGIHKFNFLFRVITKIPSFFRIMNLGPPKFRRYRSLTMGEYKVLFHSLNLYLKSKMIFKVPTLIIVDPEDELISAERLKHISKGQLNVTFKLWNRSYLSLKHGLGRHHLIVHPNYFTPNQWESFLSLLDGFLKAD